MEWVNPPIAPQVDVASSPCVDGDEPVERRQRKSHRKRQSLALHGYNATPPPETVTVEEWLSNDPAPPSSSSSDDAASEDLNEIDQWLHGLDAACPIFQALGGKADAEALEAVLEPACPGFLARLPRQMRQQMSDFLGEEDILEDAALYAAMRSTIYGRPDGGTSVLLEHGRSNLTPGAYMALEAACEAAGGVPDSRSAFDAPTRRASLRLSLGKGKDDSESFERDKLISWWCRKQLPKCLTRLMRADEAEPFMLVVAGFGVEPNLVTVREKLERNFYDNEDGLLDLNLFWYDIQAIWQVDNLPTGFGKSCICAGISPTKLREMAKAMSRLGEEVESKFWRDLEAMEPSLEDSKASVGYKVVMDHAGRSVGEAAVSAYSVVSSLFGSKTAPEEEESW